MVEGPFAERKILAEIDFMHAAKRASEITDTGPPAFERVHMHFAQPIAIVVPRPFFRAMVDPYVDACNVVVALPIIGVDNRGALGEAFDMLDQGGRIRPLDQA